MRKTIVLLILTLALLLPGSVALADPYPGPHAPTYPEADPLPDLSSGQLAIADLNDVWVMVSSTGDIWFIVFDALPYAENWEGYQRHCGDMTSLIPPDEPVCYEYDDFTYYGFYSNPDVGPPWYGYWLWGGGQLVAGRPKMSDSEASPYYGYQYVDSARLTYGMNVRNATNLVYTYQRWYNWLALLFGLFSNP